MIKITKDTFQKLLLTELSGQSKKPGDLYIFVESLPIFLSTSIAFKIFNYQLRNFPRQIIWTASEDRVLQLMKLGEIPIKPHLTKEEILSYEHNSSTPKQLINNTDVSIVEKKVTTSLTLSSLSTISIHNSEKRAELPLQTTNLKDNSKILLKELFQSSDSNRSVSIDDENMDSDILSKGKTLQDLDSWIDRIEATKKALNSMKSEEELESDSNIEPQTNTKLVVENKNFSSFLPFRQNKKQPRAYLFITSFFSCALIFILGMVFFPTNVYTLEVNSPVDLATINLSIPSTAFANQAIKTNATTSIATSGDNQNRSERALGRIDLINKSSKPVSLSNGAFSLVKDGKTYTHLRNTTLPDQIILAPFNDRSPVTITVQATELGSDSNQPVNSIFEILNILDQKPCSSCFGISTSEIIAGSAIGKKVVTEADQSLLRTTVDGMLAQQKISKIQALKEEKSGIDDIIVNNDWYNNTNSSYVFKPNLGDSSLDTSLDATVDSDVYYMPQVTLNEILQRENENVDKVTDVNIVESVGQFKEQATDIKIKVNYKFTKKLNIDKKQIEKTITSNTDFANVKEKIQKEYQGIINIDKKELGIKIPFLSPATNIKYIQTN
ncbi:MAG: hypothetical protein H7196_04385 [candidate division SR1 bacterium]|nr:hypothetical protein [candidate division SR1 bacterium]